MLRELLHRLDNPGLIGVLRLLDQLHARTPFGQRLADQQRNKRPTETDDQGITQQKPQIEAIGAQVAVNTQQAGHDTQHDHDQQVGEHQQNNAFH